jgi:hypothetical protein
MKSKYAAVNKDKLINIKDIDEELNVIEESNGDYYITRSGKVYTDYGNDMYYPMKVFKILRPHDKTKGYWYVNIKNKNNKMVSRRLHVLLAKAFIPNPNNYPCVMHLDDDGFNYNLNNLQWGTISENTKMGYINGKSHNDRGFDDSQSIPVNQYDTLTGTLIKEFGSIREAAKEVGMTVTGVSRQCKYKKEPITETYFRFRDDADTLPTRDYDIGIYNYDTDDYVGRAFNMKRAAEMVGEKPRNAQEDIYKGRKPQRKFKKRDYYFKQIPTLFSDQRDEVKTDA